MAKKRKDVNYGRKELEYVGFQLKNCRKGAEVPQVEVDYNGLEKAIKKLPIDQRESLEKFFGLVPGTTCHFLRYERLLDTHKSLDASMLAMVQKATSALKPLYTLEYISLYDVNLQKILKGLITKIDFEGTSLTEMEALQYLLVYLEVLCEGPNFFLDSSMLSEEDEKTMVFDHYSLLQKAWDGLISTQTDHSLRISMIVEWVQMLPLRERTKILQSFGITIPSELKAYVEGEPVRTFAEIRSFKEHLFPRGPWHIFENLLFEDDANLFDFEILGNMFEMIREDCGHFFQSYKTECQTDKVLECKTPSGVKYYPVYSFGTDDFSYQFTDPDELMTLYLTRRYL